MSAASREAKVAVVGATGAVGVQIADLIAARALPVSELKLFASSEGDSSREVEAGDQTVEIECLESPARLSGFDLALLAVPENVADEIVAARPGPILIDLSAANRAPSNIPLAAPGLTPRDRVNQLKVGGLFATPHPGAHVIATVLNALEVRAGFAAATIIVGAGASGRVRISELFNQSVELLNARLDLEDGHTQLAFNLFADPPGPDHAGVIAAQVSALMGVAPQLSLSVVQAPVYHGGAIALHVPAAADATEWATRLRAAPGVLLLEGGEPTGIVDAIGQEAILVRLDASAAGAALWCVYDSARLAALNALWIAENLSFGAAIS
ncbi:MAG: hypothetical protein ACREQN_10115 [Candidatus Binataceae bacterium]